MRFGKSIRTKLIIGFMGVMLPIVAFMLISNTITRDLVREKVSESYRNTMDIFVGKMDDSLADVNEYFFQMSVLDSDVGLLMSFPMDDDSYMLTKVRLDSKLNRDVSVYGILDSIFLYHKNDIIFGTKSIYGDTKSIIKKTMDELTAPESMKRDDSVDWVVCYDERVPGNYFLVNFTQVNEELFVGATILVNDINKQLGIQWSDGDIGYSGIYMREGDRLLQPISGAKSPISNTLTISSNPYDTIKSPESGADYLVMDRKSDIVNIAYRVAIPEKTLLRSLDFFQDVALFAPIGFLALLFIYLFLMRNMLFKPLQELILGMKKISLGMLDVRLDRSKSSQEFVFLGNTFNKMVEQIKTLKIDVYEEQLRVKQGELKQLQAQINPHFYMNSLNIIYNLAALNDTESVKKMSLHLADYFRFIMRSNRDTITLGEELAHIDNYITIQKMRFPDKLEFTYEASESLLNYPIMALTVQPFVENAIIHGFKNRRKVFHIEIEVEPEGPQLLIRIKDNGVGFADDVLRDLKAGVPLQEAESSRLGIMNVIHRLNLTYDDKASVSFSNRSDQSGAVVTIMLPKLPEEG
ncbi:sensor histidine kinase [Paenibacillus sp. NEAU-GSW1]|uniref:sensor histidine kinase n=1 Tax=Paenibacillus sp. NEAU-GSW1 TaxID=2682486 RepID=UPI0012E303AE|nr:sensor histidine kinase [Paenibacillus sp. NEAU-GSW1]MUT68676.1 two-component sensor histidine kinase [Paenibacillus sp. NEAU-GSW1]